MPSQNRPCARLVDSSIWIAFSRIGRLQLLLALPDICLSPAVHRELRAKPNGLAQQVASLVDDSVGQLQVDGGVAATLGWVLQGHGISQADAMQVAYVAHTPGAVLYMEDWIAQNVSAKVGASVRTHDELVDDMVGLEMLTPADAEILKQQLKEEFERSRQRRRSR